MTLEVVAITHPRKPPAEAVECKEELVRRVAASVTFAKSPRLQAFFLYVCRCALEDKPQEATEQPIGIYVFGRHSGYNPNDDNIVRSQARVLRMKLEHHFANEGKDEAIVIAIPKGQYLPIFETRTAEKLALPEIPRPTERENRHLRWTLVGVAIVLGLLLAWLGSIALTPRSVDSLSTVTPSNRGSVGTQPVTNEPTRSQRVSNSGTSEIRIAAGHAGAPYIDVLGHRWDADHYFEGGEVKPGPAHFFPPVPDEGLFKTMREAASADLMLPQWQRGFQYDIPLPAGVYELRLYFADPIRQPDVDRKEDAQNLRHLEVELNGHPLLVDLDPIADAGAAAVDVRAFKDVQPAQDGKLHLEFRSRWGQPAFVSAIELTPGTPGKLRPIRISAHQLDFIDADGTRWSGDNNFIQGRTWTEPRPRGSSKVSALYETERHGNFSYAIPVPPGSYTVKLRFLESFFSPLVPEAFCHGVGCRVFDVTCNGVVLLQDFDIVQAAGGAFRPVVREFHGLHPNGQGKLLLSFSPKANYAEVRAIEVIDEGGN
ncbi:MAG: malectin domain-containing carbohydrate-binding protein [Terracidiphilus sp.]